MEYFNADGYQSILFTIDEDHVEVGTKFTGIGHQFVSQQYSVGIKIGFGF